MAEYVVVGEWLAEVVLVCTCGTGHAASLPHEPKCGLEPIARVEDLLTVYRAKNGDS